MTSDEPDMKPIQGVYRPPKTSKWHLQKKVPTDLLDHPAIQGDEWGFRGSLKTSCLREANALAVQKLAELEALWATYRAALRVTNPEDVPPALVTAIAQQLRVLVLAEDERLREDPSALASSLAQWWQAQEHARHAAYQIECGPPPVYGPPPKEAIGRYEDPPPPPFRPATMPRWLTPRGQQEVSGEFQKFWSCFPKCCAAAVMLNQPSVRKVKEWPVAGWVRLMKATACVLPPASGLIGGRFPISTAGRWCLPATSSWGRVLGSCSLCVHRVNIDAGPMLAGQRWEQPRCPHAPVCCSRWTVYGAGVRVFSGV